jgi:hypothetical protein
VTFSSGVGARRRRIPRNFISTTSPRPQELRAEDLTGDEPGQAWIGSGTLGVVGASRLPCGLDRGRDGRVL